MRSDKAMFDKLAASSLRTLESFRGHLRGERVFCLGTGPSLITQPLGALEGKPVVCCNWGHLALEGAATPSWFCNVITDDHRIKELRPVLKDRSEPVFCVPCKFNVDPELYSEPFICMSPKMRSRRRVDFRKGCSIDCTFGVYLGRSVMFTAIQLAAFFGASEIARLGMDMNYQGARKYFDNRISTGNWNGFKYEKHGRPVLEVMRDTLGERGIKLLDATQGGMVDCLENIVLLKK